MKSGRSILYIVAVITCMLFGQVAIAQEVITEEPDTVLRPEPLPEYQDSVENDEEVIILRDTVPPGPVYDNLTNTPIEDIGVISIRPDRKIPGRASLLSAVMPGLGQVYNERYWKVPVIYAGFAVFGYLIKYNNDNYQEFRAALFAEIDGDENTINPFADILSENSLRRRADLFRRNRDFSMILAGAWYLLNIVEAHVDAHLQEFDVSEDVSMKLGPAGGNQNMYAGLKVTFYLH